MDVIEQPKKQVKTADKSTSYKSTSQSTGRGSVISCWPRAMDFIEEQELVPAKLVFNQFSARGHDLAQILLGSLLTHPQML